VGSAGGEILRTVAVVNVSAPSAGNVGAVLAAAAETRYDPLT
jgi:hypothetical protein